MFHRYQAKRAFEDIADQIRKAILDKRIKSGDRLPSERELASQFGAGRMTIREALRRLEMGGFITVKAGGSGGAFVSPPHSEALPTMIMDNFELQGVTEEQITRARSVLEPEILATALEVASPEALGDIEENVRASKEAVSLQDPELLITLLINFHICIAEASHNLPFIMFMTALAQWSRRKTSATRSSRTDLEWMCRSHEKIFTAMGSRDLPLAQRLIREDIRKTTVFRAKWRKS